MADRAWSAWYDAVIPRVPGCPLAAADYAIKRSAIEFCDRSCAWRKAVPSINSVAGTGEYVLPDVATGVKVVQLLEARWLGVKLYPKRPEQLDELYGPVDWRGVQGPPQYFTQETPNTVRLVPAPDVTTASAINGLFAAVRPKDDATGIDDAFASENHEPIAEGALRNLYRAPGMPYTNGTLSDTYGALFDSAIGNAAFRAARGNVRSPMRTKTSFT